MDFDEARDFADQGPLPDMDMEEDALILATLLKHIPSCFSADDIEQLLQDIPDQPPVVVPARTVREAVEAGDLPPLDRDAANVFTESEQILQEHVLKHGTNAHELKDLMNLWLPILLTGRVRLGLVSWVSDTQHCSPYTLGN